MNIEKHPRIADIEQGTWQKLANAECHPFMDYRFLQSLEESGCVGGETGWHPLYMAAKRDGVEAFLPAFLKTHSYGEYIFDWSWADASYRMGRRYYPKLIVASPFSPVAGARFLTEDADDEVLTQLTMSLEETAKNMGASSIHYLFCTEREKDWLARRGYLPRDTFQFQWTNEQYRTFDDFLGRFRSKRRHQIKRERKLVAQNGVEVVAVEGDQITRDDMKRMYTMYRRTVEQYYSGQLYLNEAFFLSVFEKMRERICLVQAHQDGHVIAQTFNLVADGVFYGRYWGCEKDIEGLHFEVCCYFPVQLAIERGWKRVELGAGGRHKWGRGFLPTLTHSAHRLFDPTLSRAVEMAVAHESDALRAELEQIKDDVFKPR